MIAKGSASKEAVEVKRYIGVSCAYVKAINPNKAEYKELFNRDLDEEPVYVTENEDPNTGKMYKTAKITVILQPTEEGVPLQTLNFSIQNRPFVSGTSGKTQVIDKYGRTAWVTEEDLKNHNIPVYKNGPANLDKDYRPVFRGEAALTSFVKTFLGINDIDIWDPQANKLVLNKDINPEECECRFEAEKLNNIFKGDFSEVKSAIDFQPTNKIKVMLGVRTDAESGKLYQVTYANAFVSCSSNNYKVFTREIENMVSYANTNGRVVGTEYETSKVHEYVVNPTVFTPSVEPSPVTDNTTVPSEDLLPW